ncbi:hypothetical protein BGX26_006190 [Mortierella sp. AD094]|nr:hypothetical protein BGX26_006190 [Mortierella sp. AD094]
MSLTKSTADTMLTRYLDLDSIRQHRRYTSICNRPNNAPPPAPSSLANPRRNSVVIGRNIIRQRPAIRSLYETSSSRQYPEAESHSAHQYSNYEAAHAYEDSDGSNQDFENAHPESRPYGQEEEEEEDDNNQNQVEHTAEEHNSVYDFGIHLDNDRPYLEDENDVRFFYNSVDWQMTDDVEEHKDELRFRAASDNQSSRDRLTRKATLAKKKFYKLLKPPQQAQSDMSPSREDEDEEVELDDPSRSVNSVYSVTSSLRAKMRLTPKNKDSLAPILRNNTRRKSSATHSRRSSTCTPHYEHGYDSENYYDPESVENSGMDHQEQYQHYHSGYNNEGITGYPRHASVAAR